ncbi:MAG: YtxH domain-containing protein [bacterium]|nr:YtxH domain-containing protein [bacterium]
MSQKNDNKGKVAVGAFLGVVSGLVAGLLFAPKSGKETREDIKTAAGKVVDKVQKEADDLLDQAKKVEGSLEDKAKVELTKLKVAATDARDRVKTVANSTAAKKDDASLQAALDDASSAFANLKTFLKNVRK